MTSTNPPDDASQSPQPEREEEKSEDVERSPSTSEGDEKRPDAQPLEVKITAGDLVNRKFVKQLRHNIASELILITEDKVKLVLIEKFNEVTDLKAWGAPLGILVTLITALVTMEPQQSLGLDKAVWHAVFILATLASAVWFGVTAVKAVISYQRGNCSIDAIVEKMKVESRKEEVS